METLKEKQLRILNETALAYTSKTRSIVHNVCMYYIKDSIGCAVGRLIEDKEFCKKLDSNFDEKGNIITDSSSVFHRLPSEVQELGKEFLREIQKLHDMVVNWDDEGISEQGLLLVENVKLKFELI